MKWSACLNIKELKITYTEGGALDHNIFILTRSLPVVLISKGGKTHTSLVKVWVNQNKRNYQYIPYYVLSLQMLKLIKNKKKSREGSKSGSSPN